MITRTTLTLFTASLAILAISCWSSKKAVDARPVSYEQDVFPIMQARCTPCHFPEKGKKKMLDTYQATRDNINDIITRVTLPQEHREFMPYKLKKEPLSDSMVNVLISWKEQGFPR